jgi:carboxyl-terminal processing protease
MKKNSLIILSLLAIALTPTGGLNSSSTLPFAIKRKKTPIDKAIYRWFRTVSEVVHLLSEKHYRDINYADFFQQSMKSGLSKTDPHSSFIVDHKSLRESTRGKFSGIGVTIMNKAPEDNSLIVIDTVKGGPSDKAGIQAGDKIVEINNQSLKGAASDEAIKMLRGKSGAQVEIKVIRGKKPLQFKIKRAVIKDQNLLCYNLPQYNIYYISLKMFAENTPRQTEKILKKIDNNCNGVILDLRRNPGGVLESAVDMAGLFLPKKSLVVSTKNKKQEVTASYNTKRNPILRKQIPIFMLIDNFTASASEILAGSLRYYSKQNFDNLAVFLVGTQTFGKGSVQEVIPLSNGCALKLTTMLYEVVGGLTIQANGITPDFIVQPRVAPAKEMRWVKELYGQESSLRHHITRDEAAGKKRGTTAPTRPRYKGEASKEEIAKNWEERHRKAICEDVQIHACINLINLFNLKKKTAPQLVNTREKALSFLKRHSAVEDKLELKKVSV